MFHCKCQDGHTLILPMQPCHASRWMKINWLNKFHHTNTRCPFWQNPLSWCTYYCYNTQFKHDTEKCTCFPSLPDRSSPTLAFSSPASRCVSSFAFTATATSSHHWATSSRQASTRASGHTSCRRWSATWKTGTLRQGSLLWETAGECWSKNMAGRWNIDCCCSYSTWKISSLRDLKYGRGILSVLMVCNIYLHKASGFQVWCLSRGKKNLQSNCFHNVAL